eukprot:3645089-Lingulodinium_polyedra.AAC.1
MPGITFAHRQTDRLRLQNRYPDKTRHANSTWQCPPRLEPLYLLIVAHGQCPDVLHARCACGLLRGGRSR